ncbi:hypothetical protein HOA91_06280 [Candidatus Woesearchaeota archaeon]|jgi:hypothetical protein|nr:hypothetical protein [Candidatus Woesearchaeota archaeon]
MSREKTKREIEEPLTTRLTEGITNCLVKKNYQGDGYDKQGNLVHYCAFFNVSNQYQPMDCGFRGEQLEILVGDKRELNHHYLSFYKCCNIKNKKKRWRR